MMKNNKLPNFLIIGAGKSGTTSLDKYLAKHPDIYMSHIKEPNFFAYLDVNPEIFKDIPETYNHCLNSIRQWKDYYRLFDNASDYQLIGETSNTYLTVDNALYRIKEFVPDVKMIAILRNPVDRLYSRYLHLARDNRLHGSTIEDVFDKESIWWRRNDLVNEGFYYKNLERFYNHFNPDQLMVIRFEDMVRQRVKTLNMVFDFLGVKRVSNIDFDIEYNPSGIIKNQFLNKVIGHESIIMKGFKTILFQGVYEKFKTNQFLQGTVTRIRKSNLHKPELDPEIKSRITNEIYLHDISKLETLINEDLSSWKD